MKLLVVCTDIPTEYEQAKLSSFMVGHSPRMLSFVEHSEETEQWMKNLSTQGVEFLDASQILKQAGPVAREKFLDFVARWPQDTIIGEKSFKEKFVYESCLSLWWLTELSQKNQDTRHTFWHLCKLEALRLALVQAEPDCVVLLTRNRDLRNIFDQAVRAKGIKIHSFRLRRKRSEETILRLLIGRLLRLGFELVMAILALLNNVFKPLPHPKPSAPLIAFHSWYGQQWVDWHGKFRDRYYVDWPDDLAASGNWEVIYPCLARTNSVLDSFRILREGEKEASLHTGVKIIFLERFASLWEILTCFLRVDWMLQYLWLEFFSKSFRESFQYDHEINIFSIAHYDLRSTFVCYLPMDMLLARRIRNFVRQYHPIYLFTIIELYTYGRALTYGAKSGWPSTRVIGYQHSRTTRYHLYHNYIPGELQPEPDNPTDWVKNMPLPDMFLLHGEHTRRVLANSGYPSNQMLITGCPRFDYLKEFLTLRSSSERRLLLRREMGLPDGKYLILIAGVIWPNQTHILLQMVLSATVQWKDVYLVVKPHPLYKNLQHILDIEIHRTGHKACIIKYDDVQSLMAVCDVMVTTNSTAGAEAVAIQCPVINVCLSDIDLSPFVEVPGAAPEVNNVSQLSQELRTALDGNIDRSRWPEIVEGVFYRLDGCAKERLTAWLMADSEKYLNIKTSSI